MIEDEYWSRLEYRLCDEFKGMSDRRFDKLWCDGFIPGAYLIHDQVPMVQGKVWIVKDQNQTEWKFQLILPRPFDSVEAIEWDRLLPPSNMTKWLELIGVSSLFKSNRQQQFPILTDTREMKMSENVSSRYNKGFPPCSR